MFEFVDHTALDELEKHPNGADENYVKKMMWQVLKGIEFCHVNNVRKISKDLNITTKLILNYRTKLILNYRTMYEMNIYWPNIMGLYCRMRASI